MLSGKFTLYFPYILLISALVLAGIERLFKKIFKTNIQIDGFHSLLLNAKKLETDAEKEMEMEDTVHTVEVWQSFKAANLNIIIGGLPTIEACI